MQVVAQPLDPAGQGMLPRRLWLATLVVGGVLWAAVAAAILATGNTILAPNLILLGTFLVPVCTVLFVLSRPRPVTELTVQGVIVAFLAGGMGGVVLAGTLLTYVLPDAAFTNTVIGLVEESVKAVVLVGVAWVMHVRPRFARDGMVLGAVVGAGFSAFESAGYALGEMIKESPRHPVLRVLETQAFRAVLAPFGHITWSAILGGAIFAAAGSGGRWRIDRRVAFAFVGVVALHAAWDAAYGLAIDVVDWTTGAPIVLRWPATASWAGEPTDALMWRWQAVYDGMLAVLAVAGFAWALRCWRAAVSSAAQSSRS
jgi:RsiW-degrading membrane proteinase PrsW (M82 family)